MNSLKRHIKSKFKGIIAVIGPTHTGKKTMVNKVIKDERLTITPVK